ncbi:MAG: ABC transporter ATP-binding protein, partial [Alphaproteobacteria bacterium HGW-Alphaproteobacteria-5]
GIKDVKLLGLEQTYLARYHTPSRRLGESASLGQVIGEMPRHLLEAIAFGGMILLALVLLARGSGQLVDVLPTLGVFAFAGLRMIPAMQQIYLALTQMRYIGAMLDNVHRDTVETGARSPRALPEVPVLRLGERLDLVEVSYAYPQAGRGVLQGLSLTIPARTTAGIVGGTGAGKTTAVDLILGLLAPDSGEIRVDGVPLTPGNLRGWQRTLGYVPQQIFLLDDTVAANIAFGIPPESRDMAAVERAARLAELHGFVTEELPQGYETMVGERGVRLSGGQRQRIGIARALYHDPDVLILDEATSALDTLTERAVMEAVANVAHAKTVIMIAHRLSTVKGCDTIFLLDRGRLAAQGSYADLVATNETFRRMAGG